MKLAFSFFLVVLFLISPKAKAFDESYLVGRAINLAEFKSDEKVALPEIKYLLNPGDRERPDIFDKSKKIINIFDAPLSLGGVQAIFTAPVYKINDQNSSYTIKSFKRGVGDILKDGGVVLAKEDKITPAAEEEPSAENGNLIKITRVVEAEIENYETLPYQSKEILDNTLEKGKTTTKQKGINGKKRLLYLVRRENGLEVSKKLIKEEIIDKPQDQITLKGTKIVVLSSLSGEASWTKGATAMRNYKKGTLIRIKNLENGKSVETRVGGWGPQPFTNRILDLDQDSFSKIGDLGKGTINVLVEELKE